MEGEERRRRRETEWSETCTQRGACQTCGRSCEDMHHLSSEKQEPSILIGLIETEMLKANSDQRRSGPQRH